MGSPRVSVEGLRTQSETQRERARAREPRERSGANGAPASERARGLGTQSETQRERARAREPRERSGANGAPASERARGLGTQSPDKVWSGLRGSNPSNWLGKPGHYHYAKPAAQTPNW